MRACHNGGRPCFVNEDQAFRVQIRLARDPFTPRACSNQLASIDW
jgi:hypothetical protein